MSWQPKPGPVKALAGARGIPVLQPSSLKSEAERAPILAIPLDVLVVVAYGLILPPSILEWPGEGCINIHASLLPRWRGAAPIQRALLAGDGETGITLMWLDEGLDTGPIIERHPVPIAARDTAGTLHDWRNEFRAPSFTNISRRRNDNLPMPKGMTCRMNGKD